jgi:hypothetical protein
MPAHTFRPGDQVVWLRNTGGFVFPVGAKVLAVTAKRVTIAADDPDERGEGTVTRHVSPDNLQPILPPPRPPRSRPAKAPAAPPKRTPPAAPFENRYPHITLWVKDGWIEIGHDDCQRSFLRVVDIGGLVWESDESYASLDDALRAMDTAIAEWLEEHG